MSVNGTASIFSNSDDPLEFRSHFTDLSSKFAEHHENEMNILLHMLTTPLGFLGVMSLIRVITNSSTIGVALALFYILSLVQTVSFGVLLGTALLCFIIVMSSRHFQMGLRESLLCVALGYGLQELAHIMTGELPYDSSYAINKSMSDIDLTSLQTWGTFFVDHCYYLLPLCVDLVIPKASVPNLLLVAVPTGYQNLYTNAFAMIPLFIWALGSYCLDSKNGFCFFPGAHYSGRVLQCNLAEGGAESRKGDLKEVRDWAISKLPSRDTSSHWWFKDLDKSVREAFDRCSKSSIINKMFRDHFSERHYCVDIVEGMNEVYVTGPSRKNEAFNSDQIFYSKHVDGPLGLIPFVSVYRCIVGMDKNLSTFTHFPMKPLSKNACEGEVLAFDFNREIHYITKDTTKEKDSDDFRVVLKLHYCMYPRVLAPLGWLMHTANVLYNQTFRALFLKTIQPKSLYEHFLAWNVVFNTSLFNNVETYIGQRNVIYLILGSAASYITGNSFIFFAMTSFMHYVRYISTYYYRSEIDYGSFKRDVLMFKTLALTQLFLVYLFPQTMAKYVYGTPSIPFEFDFVSMIMIASGYCLSVLATHALGLDRTYFGVELGFCEYKRTNQFPYGPYGIPHPMIVSQVWALLGFYKAAHLRFILPYAIPVHVLLYLTHMAQEHFDIYDRSSKMKQM